MMLEPIKRTIIIEKIIWDCGHPHHHHQSEKMARGCIKRGNREESIYQNYVKKAALQMRAITAALNGDSIAKAAQDVQRAPARVREWIRNAASRAWENPEVKKLSTNMRPSLDELRRDKAVWLPAIQQTYDEDIAYYKPVSRSSMSDNAHYQT